MVTKFAALSRGCYLGQFRLIQAVAPLALAGLAMLGLLAAMGLWRPQPALAAGPLYVAPGGTDSGNCTNSAAPCATVQYAANQASAGDEIRVATGLYSGVTFRASSGTTQTVYLDKSLILRGGYTTTNWLISNPKLYATILNAGGQGRVIYIDGAASPTVEGFTIRNGAIGGNGGGIYVYGGAPVIAANTIYSNTATSFGGAIYNSTGSPRLERNTIYSNTAAFGGGLYNFGGTIATRNDVFFQNLANNAGGGLINNTSSTGIVQNDVFYDNRAQQAGGIGNGGILTVSNTIVVRNTATDTGGIYHNGSFSGTIALDHNDVWNNTGGDYGGTPPDPGSISADPLFVNAPSGDFHLQATSPAINAGITLAAVTDDFDNNGRPFGPAYDIGADEYYAPSTCYARLNNSRVYTAVQDAVNAATPGSLVQVAGTCAGVRTQGGVVQTVYISQSLTVRGGYTVTDWINPRYGPTILNAQNLGRVVYIATGSGAVTLDGLHIRNGSATGSSLAGYGGGIYVGSSVNATLQNNAVYGNHADNGGGVYKDDGGQALLQFDTLYGNSAAQEGAGIYASGAGLLTLRNSIVATNTATSSEGGISSVGGSTNTALDYNDFFENSPNNYDSTVTPGLHDILLDPGLANPAGADFHLVPTSTVINAADPAATLDHDFDGDTRPQGARRDIGADESVWYTGVDLGESPTSPVVVTDTSAIAGTFITFTHTITNVGNTSGLTDTFAITASNSAGWPVSLAGINSPVVLTQGIPQSFQVVVAVPSVISAGIYNETFLIATSQTNSRGIDTASDAIANPALLLAPSYTENADPGEVVTYTHTLTNIGATGTFTLSVVSSRGWGQLIAPTGLITLAHGETAQIVVQARVTDTAPVNLADVMTVRVSSINYPVSAVVTDTTIANPTIGDRYVAKSGGVDTDNNCTQSTAPCLTISYAVSLAAWGDTIRVAQGVYPETDIFINQNVSLRGSFDPGWAASDPALYPTIIDAQGRGRVLRVQIPSGPLPVVGGFTLRNGATAGVGGAIYLRGSSALTLTQLVIENASATQEGGAIYIEGGAPVLQTVVISGARSSANGGGIYVNGGTPLLQGVAISYSTGVNGAGLYVQAGSPIVRHLTLEGNTASGQGGGVYLDSGALTISQTVASRNTARDGAGFYNRAGSMALWNDMIYSNTATSGGGGGVYNGGTLSMVNDTLYSNHAATRGGGVLHVNNGSLVISNTIVATNSATSGGGIYNDGSGSVTTAYNDLWGNTVPESNIAAGAHSIAADPMFVNAAAGDLHLSPTSPALDSADPRTFLAFDFEDDIRPVNQGFDMGADEVAGCLARVTYPDGSFASGPYGVVQDAVDAAGPHYTVQIFGVCRGVQPRQLASGQWISQTVFISQSLTLEGGYDNQFKSTGGTAVLDAQGLGRVVVVTDTDVAAAVIISRLILTGGDAARSGGDAAGGGIYNYDSILTVKGSVISGNQATYGGGLYNLTGALTLDGDTEDARTYVLSNSATYGGGLYLAGDSPAIRRATIGGNQASQGGGLYNAGASPILSQARFYSNTASLGGAIYNAGGLLSAQIITVTGNTASNGGGAVYNGGGELFLERSLLLGNAAGTSGTGINGGGLFNATGVLTVVNTLVASNTARGDGGGLYNASGSVLALRHDDFYANRATGNGGGIYDGSSTAPVINSTIIISNTAGASGGGIYSGPNANFGYNDVLGNSGGNYNGGITGPIGVDPAFISLDGASASFLRITAGSPVEDKADPASPVTNDIDGDPRPSNQAPDIGADELGGCYVRNPLQNGGQGIVYGNIQVAVDASGAGDRLQVAGICQGVNARSALAQTVFLSKTLSLQGGYDHTDWTLAPDPVARPTIVDALGLGRVAYITSSAVISIDGLHLRRGSAADGGAIFLGSGVLTMTHDLVYSSSATARGGGLFNQGGTAYLYGDNQIFTNTAAISGGAIYQAGGRITLDDNVLRGNQAASGGAFYHAGGTSLLQNNIIWSNQATTNGGGVYNTGITLTVRHNTFYANKASSGGGFYTANNNPVLSNNIFYAVSPSAAGHAIASVVSYTPTYNDTYPSSPDPYGGSASAGAGSLNFDPRFVNAANGDFHLLDTSQVIDRGDPTMAAIYDFDGDLRPSNQGFDMGADEWAKGCLAQVVHGGQPGQIYGNIQRAINNSQPGDEIRVTQGDCRGVHQYQAISQTIHITQSLTLSGMYINPVFLDPFRGYTTPNFDVQYNGGVCLDSGSPLTDTLLNPLSLGRAVLITNSAVVTMEGFQLLAGNAAGLGGRPGGGNAGGALYVAPGSRASLSSVDPYSSTVANTAQYGGAIYNGGTLILQGVWALSNTATADGGVIYNTGVLTVTSEGALAGRSTNWCANQAAGRGGSIYNQGGQVWLTNLTHQDLITTSRALTGGAIYNESGRLTASKFELGYNIANYQGGAIYNQGGTLTLQGNNIHHNQAVNTGVGYGAGLYNGGNMTLDLGNRFHDNFAGQGGGAIYNTAVMTAWNTLIYSNTAIGTGAGIHDAGGTSSVLHNTFYKNVVQSATGLGGGVYAGAGSHIVKNNIFDSNVAVITGSAIYGAAGTLALGYNDYWPGNASSQVSYGSGPGGNNLNANPYFVDVSQADFHLEDYSPVINRAQAGLGVLHDFENDPRPVNSGPDMGADENNLCQAQVASTGHIWGQIQTALDEARATGDEVRVAEGTCEGGITINKTITLSGSWDRRFTSQYSRVISTTLDALDASRVITVTGSVTVTISQIEATGGNAGNGGGILSQAKQLDLRLVAVTNSRASGDGGGIYVSAGSHLNASQITIFGNYAVNGGGIYGGLGSDIYILGNGGIFGNYATGNGGGMYNTGNTVYLSGASEYDNQAGGNGGGYYNHNTDFRTVNEWCSGNQATNGAGIYNDGSTSADITNMLLYDNTAAGSGGALYSGGGNTALYHATLNENQADQGGAVYNAGGSVVISASIVANSNTTNGNDMEGAASVDYTLRSPGTTSSSGWGSHSLEKDPRFVPSSEGKLLNFDSPAIDAVPNEASTVSFDAFNNSRPQFCAKDMGIDEYWVNPRGLGWWPPSPAQANLAPTESVTYTFALSNTGENMISIDPYMTRGVGSGYTESLTITLSSSHKWAEIVGISGGANGTIVDTDTATVDIGPWALTGQVVSVSVRVTVPAGTFATLPTDDSTKEFTWLTYQARQCPGQAPITGDSQKAETWVKPDYNFAITPDHFGTAAPGQTVTFTHILTNLGNLTDTYNIYSKPGFYATGEIAEPTSFLVENLAPGMTATIVISVTIDSVPAGGLSDIVYATGRSQGDPNRAEKSAADNMDISDTTGIRYVTIISGTDSLNNPNAPPDLKDNNCTDFSVAPCRTIQHAIDEAAPGDEIWIGGGVYTNVVTATEVVYLNKSVALRGGYNSSHWDWTPNPFSYTTTLDGQDLRRVIYLPAGYTPTIQYLNLANGRIDVGDFSSQVGGCLYNAGSDLVLDATAIHNCYATAGGGGLYSAGGDLLLQNNTIYRNETGVDGGGLHVAAGSARLENNTFHANYASGSGGGIYSGAAMAITNTIVVSNAISGPGEAASWGAGIYNAGTISRLTYNNLAFNYYDTASGTAPDYDGNPPVISASNVALLPNFVDQDGDDYHLGVGSPMINAGTSAVATTEDFEGEGRPQMGVYDIGADEVTPRRDMLFYPNYITDTTAGTQIVFTHTLQNLGEYTDTFVISWGDSLGWPMTFDQLTPYTITLGSLVTKTVQVTVTVPPSATGQTDTLVITATSSPAGLVAFVQDTIHAMSPEWQIGKTVTPSPTVRPGDLLTYTLTIANIGELPTSGAYTITDQLPANTTYVGATPAPALTSTTAVTWYSSSPVAAGASFTRSLVVRVTQPLTDGTLIANQTYGIGGGQAYTQAWGLPVTVTVGAPASLSITKTASASSLTAGDWLTYTITVSNSAAAAGPALGVVVSDTLPGNVDYQSMGFIPPAGGVFTDAGRPLLLWQLADPIPVGGSAQVTAAVRITSPQASPIVLINSYGLTATNIPARLSGSITNTVISTNSLSLSKAVQPAAVLPGGVVTYTITLTNSGNGLANVVLTDMLSTGFTPPSYITNVVVPGRSWGTTAGNATVAFTATAPVITGTYYNRWLTATFDLSGTTSISQVAPVSVEVPQIRVTKQSVPNPVPSGAQLSYTIVVTNIGNLDLHDVVVTDTLPAHVTPSGVLTWAPTITAPGSVWMQTVDVTVEAGYVGVLTNVVRVASAEGATDIFTQTTAVVNAQLTVDKQANVATANVGQTITYTYRVTNTGAISLTTIVAADDRLGPINLASNTLEPGQATSGTATYTVQESDLPGPLVNTVAVTSTSAPPFGAEVLGQASESVNLTYTADITIAKTPDGATVRAGDLITFTIAITNLGDVTLAPITVTDTLAPNCGSAVPTLAPQGSTSYTCTMVALPDSFTNTATVAGTGPGGSVATAGDDAFVNVVNADIAIAKTPASQMARSGESVTFTFFITNTGNVTMSPITVTDILPSTCDRIIPVLTATQVTSYTCSLSAQADDFTNTAIVSGTSPLGELVTDTNSAFVDVIHPSIDIAKTPDSQVAQIGDPVTFTITVTNTGDVDLPVVVTDMEAPGCDWAGSLAGSPVHEEFTYTCTVTAPANDFTNVAVVTGMPPDARVVTDTDDAFVNVIAPAIAVAKTPDSQTAISGQPVTFTIFITNTGDVTITTVAVSDALSSACDHTETDGLDPNESTSYDCSFLAGADDFTNTVVVTGAVSSGGIVTNTDTAFVNVLQSGLTIAKTPDEQMVLSGDRASFTILITNTGDVTLTTVVITDDLAPNCSQSLPDDIPAGASVTYDCTGLSVTEDFTNVITATGVSSLGVVVTGTDTALVNVINPEIALAKMPASQMAQSGDPVTFTIVITNIGDVALWPITVTDVLAPDCDNSTIPSLAPGVGSIPCIYTCTTIAPADDFTNTVVVTGTSPTGAPVTDEASAFVDVIHPSLVITKTPDTQMAQPGDLLVFTITVANTSDVTMTTLAVSDALNSACDQTFAGVPAGESRTYYCPITAGADDFVNTVVVTGAPPTGRVVTNADTAFVDVIHPNFAVAKTPVSQTVASGGMVTFTVTVTNTGDALLSPITVTDELVPGCSYIIPSLASGSDLHTCTRSDVTADFTNTVVVTGSPQAGAAQTRVATATVSVVEPIVGLAAINNSPTLLGNSTTLTATITAGTHVVYTWNFGDGLPGIITSQTAVTHTYPATGTFTAVVTASNGISTLTATTPVEIVDRPVTGLNVTSDSPTTLGHTTTLTATAGGSNLVYAWDFGDGSPVIIGSQSVVAHTYTATDTFTVVVTASNSTNSLTATTSVVVVAPEAGGAVYLPIIMKNYAPSVGPTPIPPKPDLVVTNLSVTPNGTNQYTVSATVYNQSATAVNFGNNFYVAVYVDPTEPFTGTQLPASGVTPIIQWGVQGSWYGAGQSRTSEAACTFSGSQLTCISDGTTRIANLGANPHRFYAWADPYETTPANPGVGTVDESNENNNYSTPYLRTLSGLGGNVVPLGGPPLSPGPQPTPTNVP